MKTLSNLKPARKRTARKRLGRGPGSGTGTYSGRGLKGQKARSGGRIRPGFEGGRMPLIRQMPKNRGFKSTFPKNQAVSLGDLDRLFKDGDEVTLKVLETRRLIANPKMPVKILAKGQLTKKLQIKNIKLSTAAKEAVSKQGGKVFYDNEKTPADLEA